VSTVAGNNAGFCDGRGSGANFNNPWDIAFEGGGNLLVADCSNHRVRMVNLQGVVTTIVGVGADGMGGNVNLSRPRGITIDANGNIFVTDENHQIHKFSPGAVH